MAPTDVKKEDEDRIWVQLYGDGDTELKRHRIADGAKVRVNRVKGAFEKGYMPNWSHEQFVATKLTQPDNKRKKASRPVYELRDTLGEEVKGKWYPEELQAVNSNDLYEIEKVLKRRTLPDGTKEVFVKWLDFAPKFNSWVRADKADT